MLLSVRFGSIIVDVGARWAERIVYDRVPLSCVFVDSHQEMTILRLRAIVWEERCWF